MRKPMVIALLSAAVLTAASPSIQAASFADQTLSVASHASGFSTPTGVRFLGNSVDDFFVIEKNTGQVKRVLGGVSSTVLDLDVQFASERGLLGIELHPSFNTNGFVYLYYSATDFGQDTSTQTWTRNRLSRFTWNGAALTNETPLLDFDNDPAQNNGANHDGGPIKFGPDGKLYGTTGDLNRNRAEQNNQNQSGVSSDAGGIYRINDDGTIPVDNPFVGSAIAGFDKWFAYGVRNSFGLAFDPVTSDLWDTENGPGSYDEVNRVVEGFNSGWNKIMGPDSRDAQGVGDLVVVPGSTYSDPAFSWNDTVAPTALVFLHGSMLGPAYDDAVMVGDNNTGRIYLMRLNANRDGFVFTDPQLLDLVAEDFNEANLIAAGQNFGAVTDMLIGPDGALYILSYSNGELFRVIPEPTGALILATAVAGMLVGKRRRR